MNWTFSRGHFWLSSSLNRISKVEAGMLLLDCEGMIGLSASFLSGAGVCAELAVMSEAAAPCGGGGGWMASDYKVQEKCARRAIRE